LIRAADSIRGAFVCLKKKTHIDWQVYRIKGKTARNLIARRSISG
jgi:hypothetical protein